MMIIIIMIKIKIIIIIIAIMIGAYISIFPNQFKAPQGWICKPAANGRYLLCESFTFTVQKLIYSSVNYVNENIIVKIVKMQVNGPLSKTERGGCSKPEYPEKTACLSWIAMGMTEASGPKAEAKCSLSGADQLVCKGFFF